jgi:hypothetical protein
MLVFLHFFQYFRIRVTSTVTSKHFVHAWEMESATDNPNKKRGRSINRTNCSSYIVKSTDSTLASVALHHNVSLAQLQQLNNLYSTKIFVGQIIYIPNKVESNHVTLEAKNEIRLDLYFIIDK